MAEQDENTDTDFGFEQVAGATRRNACAACSIPWRSRYDVMNDLMSAGTHRLWKRFTLSCTNLRAGQRALDVAGGTGDLSLGMLKQVGPSGLVVLTDINAEMLVRGRDRLIDAGHLPRNARVVQANAECLPFTPGAVRLRDHRLRTAQCHRQARRAALDAQHAASPAASSSCWSSRSWPMPALRPLYDAYSFQDPAEARASWWPAMPTATATWPSPSASIPTRKHCCRMMRDAGLENCSYQNLSGGVVAVHRGYVY